MDESPSFAALIKYDIANRNSDPDPIERLPGILRGRDRPLQYHLRAITPWDFDSLVAGLRPRYVNSFSLLEPQLMSTSSRLGVEIPYEQLCPMLALATDWNFPALRSYAIDALSKVVDEPPVPRILLARRSNVKKWLLPAYIQLAQRLAPLTAHESELLGNLPTLAVFRARFAVMENRLHRIGGLRPGVLMGKSTFWHPTCWTVLCTAWRSAITTEVGDLEGAMIEALLDLKTPNEGQRRGMSLCKNCNSHGGIVKWMQLEQDELVARKVLQACIGDMEPWTSMSTD